MKFVIYLRKCFDFIGKNFNCIFMLSNQKVGFIKREEKEKKILGGGSSPVWTSISLSSLQNLLLKNHILCFKSTFCAVPRKTMTMLLSWVDSKIMASTDSLRFKNTPLHSVAL